MDNPKTVVVGKKMTKTLAEYERRGLILLEEEQAKLLPDNALVDFLCESVRLVLEYKRSWSGEDPEGCARLLLARLNEVD